MTASISSTDILLDEVDLLDEVLESNLILLEEKLNRSLRSFWQSLFYSCSKRLNAIKNEVFVCKSNSFFRIHVHGSNSMAPLRHLILCGSFNE